MAVDIEVGEAGSVGSMEQFGGLRELDQDVGLFRSAPPHIPAFFGDGFIERRHAASGLLQLRPQRHGGLPLLPGIANAALSLQPVTNFRS